MLLVLMLMARLKRHPHFIGTLLVRSTSVLHSDKGKIYLKNKLSLI